MATVTAAELTRIHRRQQQAVRAQTLRELAVLYPALDLDELDASWPVFAVAVGALVARQRRRSAGVASAYLRAMRLAHGLDGAAGIRLAEPVAADRLATSLHATSVGAAKRATAAGLQGVAVRETAFVQSSGAVARHVLDGGRETVMRSTAAMPDAKGWHRVASPSACTFCRTLAGRDELYRSEASGDFGSHDHCGCDAEPVFWAAETGVSPEDYRRKVAPYVPSAREETPAFSRAAQRAYLGG